MSTKSGKNNSDKDKFKIQPYRRWIQVGFLFLTVWIGIDFFHFVNQLQKGITPAVSRPPGVEAFLPISALISFKYWLYTGIFNTIHPSALVLLLIFIFTSLLLKKGFCSWICPFGLLSEGLTKIHKWIFDKQFNLPKWLDYPLRSLKYLLLFFFVWAIFGQMTVEALHKFIYSPYNRVADIKMLYFFSNMSSMTFWVLMLLVGLSIAIPYFWCRYLCPYGALVGAISWLSPFKIHRNETTCIDCDKCTKVCPANIQVHKAGSVYSDECHACLYCMDACPVKDTLYLSVTQKGFKISRKVYAFAIVIIFVIGVSLAQLLDVWRNKIPANEYIYHLQNINASEYNHNQGEVSAYDEEKWQPRSYERIMELDKSMHK
jgi:polyferredoxin